jgi:hypothetical protein
MTTSNGAQWIETDVMGIRYRYCKETNELQRKYIYKVGWETMPDRPDLAKGRKDITDYILKGGDDASTILNTARKKLD